MCCKGMSMYLQTCRSIILHQLQVACTILQLPNLLPVRELALLRMSARHPATLPSQCTANMELMELTSLALGFVAISSMSSAVK